MANTHIESEDQGDEVSEGTQIRDDLPRETFSASTTTESADALVNATNPSPPTARPVTFFSLPRELRDQVYTCALARPQPFSIGLTVNEEYHNSLPITASRQARIQNLLPPPLTNVSRQLRSESMPIFYECNTFIASLVRPTKYVRSSGFEIGYLPHEGMEILGKWLRYLRHMEMGGKVGKLVVCRYRNEDGEKALTREEFEKDSEVELPERVEETHVNIESRDEEVYGEFGW